MVLPITLWYMIYRDPGFKGLNHICNANIRISLANYLLSLLFVFFQSIMPCFVQTQLPSATMRTINLLFYIVVLSGIHGDNLKVIIFMKTASKYVKDDLKRKQNERILDIDNVCLFVVLSFLMRSHVWTWPML